MNSISTAELYVVNRHLQRVPLDISKIRRMIQWACQGLNVNPIELESALQTKLRPGISTTDIQENLIIQALNLCKIESPNWNRVAGRLFLWNYIEAVKASRGFSYDGYTTSVTKLIECGRYSKRITDFYSEEDLKKASSWIDPTDDYNYDYAGAVLLTNRYLLEGELPQEAFLTIALLLASVESPMTRLPWAYKFYRAIAHKKISLATPILSNLRTPNGSLTSCFITAMEDDLDSIFHEITNTAKISKKGGGVGVNVSRIRATGSPVNNRKNSSGGIVPWVKLLNDTAIAVNQGGKRAGAVTVGLDIWHYDTLELLELQTENGDMRRKAFDIFPQLIIPDEFMRRVVSRKTWTLVDPYEVKTKLGIDLPSTWGQQFEKSYRIIENKLGKEIFHYKHIDARELFKQIMKTQIETGLPYLAFKDTINQANPNKHLGYIPQVNLCTESFSNVHPQEEVHCCNLVSLNLANLDTSELPYISQLAVRLLDNTIDLTSPPIEEALTHNNRYRTIGIGAMGLADWLAKNKLSYDSTKDISNLFEDIGFYTTSASMELARERGAYSAFSGSEWSKGLLMNSLSIEEVQQLAYSKERWKDLSQKIKLYGIRNSHITAIAPNTSSSLLQGCTASILPPYSHFFYDRWAKGTAPIIPPYIEEYQWFYPQNKFLRQEKIVKVVSTIQTWIDTGISMELLFNLNEGAYAGETLDVLDVFNILILAWQTGCKAVYYIRTIQKDDFKAQDSCESCAN